MKTTTPASEPALAAHTPGEWSLDGIQNNSGATTSIIIRSSAGNASHGKAPYVGEVSWPREGLRRPESAITDEDWANARLLVSAPRALASLSKLVTWAETYARIAGIDSEVANGPLSTDIREARAIMARAKGQP